MSKNIAEKLKLLNSVLSWISIILVFVVFILPIVRIEWSTKTLGIKEEYYANVSSAQCIIGTKVQIHSKTIEGFKNSDFFDSFSNDEVSELFEEYEASQKLDLRELKANSNTSDSFIYMPIITVSMFLILMLLNQMKSREKFDDIKKLLETHYLNDLTPKQRRIYFLIQYKTDTRPWTIILVAPIILFFGFIIIFSSLDGIEGYALNINTHYAVGFILVIGIMLIIFQKITNKLIKEVIMLDAETER